VQNFCVPATLALKKDLPEQIFVHCQSAWQGDTYANNNIKTARRLPKKLYSMKKSVCASTGVVFFLAARKM